MVNYNIEINGLPVEAVYTDSSINDIFIPLLERLTKLQEQKQKLILVMLAAPPGAGKSTLSSFLQKLSEETEGVKPITVIGMDGFHHYQDYLMSHTTERDGVIMDMVKIKGAPITFDLELLEKRIEQVASGEECGWPIYDRLKHNPQENAITVSGDIVLLEGNYLLLGDEGWSDLKNYADYTIRIDADEKDLRDRLINRKIMTGVSREDAEAFVDFSDMYNARLCLNNCCEADMVLRLHSDNSYSINE